MLKKIALSISCLALATTSYCQSTLTGATFNPTLGDAFSVIICDTTGVLPGVSGPSALWNFSTLVTSHPDTGRVVAKTAGTGHWNYPSANLAIKGPTFFSPTTTYYNATSSVLAQYGYYITSDTNLVLTNPVDQLRYPFTYPNTYSDTYLGTLRFGLATAHHSGTINVECDGWGMLVLPSGTHSNVLRVHSTQQFTDSTNLFGTPVMKTYNISSYDWYKPNYHSALLTIQTVTELASVTPSQKLVAYAAQQFSAVDDVEKNIAELQLSPNPATTVLNISYKATTKDPVKITMYDMLGREVAVIAEKQTQDKQQASFNTKSLPRGMYLVTLQCGEEAVSRKIELQ